MVSGCVWQVGRVEHKSTRRLYMPLRRVPEC
jgi:hypothetical protein